ncbi:ATP-grasp domain-containing protein [Portibacter lacus]|uniref:Glutathione synthetase n=1 Tax=Portibacter lacus TaxID=1099794 RepID=A0AA37WGN2_9BACT|nr:glutathione synthetase [Portibacter lacus]GLR20083.1 glutathione synthetase [Portibacter lacus]
MNILILTDHRTHSSSNSFYLIANSLNEHTQVNSVTVASRSLETNKSFFSGEKMELSVKHLDEAMSYESFDEWIQTNPKTVYNLDDFDYILLRLPRPIHENFFTFLGRQIDERKVINRPSGISKTGNKQFLLNVKDYCPPVTLVENIEDIKSFKSNFPIVLKPLEDYGGRGIIKIEGDKVSIGIDRVLTFEEFSQDFNAEPQAYLAMKFLKNVKNGDKRIVVANGHILTSSVRFPADGSWLCNVAQGGSAALSDPTNREKEIIAYIDPILAAEGVFMYGLDTLEDDTGERIISEINTLSVGGIAPAAEMSGMDLGKKYADLFVNFVENLEK